jgi:hypothetical protein
MECVKCAQDRITKTVVKEMSKYKFDFVGVQQVRWDRVAPSIQVYIFLWIGECES